MAMVPMLTFCRRLIFPPSHSWFVTAMSMVSLSLSTLGVLESIGMNSQYSKFWHMNVEKSTGKQIKLGSRTGMLIIYIPAFLAAIDFSGLFPNDELRFLLLKSALAMHFFKRILEEEGEKAMAMVPMLGGVLYPQPPPLLVTVMCVVSLVTIAYLGINESIGKHVQYSKFWNLNIQKSTRKQIKLSSTIGMLILYTPAFLAAIASFGLFPNKGIRLLLVKATLTTHFFKRILEVLFVHKYSGGVALDSVIGISFGYFTSTSTMIYAQHLTQGFLEPLVDLKIPGILLFLLGISGNFYHHQLLASLRTEGEKVYKVPKGGLFGLVACPHYLFEILSCLGISFISQTLYAFSVTISTICYLMGRGYATRRWYLSKFEDFPKEVKALIPYVF